MWIICWCNLILVIRRVLIVFLCFFWKVWGLVFIVLNGVGLGLMVI